MSTHSRSTLKNLNILFIEDDQSTAEAISMIFGNILGSLSIAEDFEEGFRLYKEVKPDIIVTDILLPGESGLDLIAEIRKVDKEIPVVAISGLDSADVLLESIDVNISKYFYKPVNMRKLLSYLSEVGSEVLDKRKSDRTIETMQKILDMSYEYYLVCEKDCISYINQTFLEFLGYADGETFSACKGADCEIKVIKEYEDETATPFMDWVCDVRDYDSYETIISLLRPGSLKSDAKSYIARVNKLPDEDRHVISFVDVTAIEREKQFFHNLAHKDPLTNIYNRMKFFDELSKESNRADRYNKEFAIIMFDIDKFKLVNDTYGHQVGDMILKQVVSIVNENIRATDVFARYGGEEFIILAPEINLEGAKAFAEKLRNRIERFKFDFAERVTCSFGVSHHEKGCFSDDSIRLADEALYKAKRTGRNQVC